MRQCSVKGCRNKHKGRGYCNFHYSRWLRGKPIDAPRIRHPAKDTICSVDDCTRMSYAHGVCYAHYVRIRMGMSLKPPLKWRNKGEECKTEDCTRPAICLGWCKRCYERDYYRY